jgi:hypothetical protein
VQKQRQDRCYSMSVQRVWNVVYWCCINCMMHPDSFDAGNILRGYKKIQTFAVSTSVCPIFKNISWKYFLHFTHVNQRTLSGLAEFFTFSRGQVKNWQDRTHHFINNLATATGYKFFFLTKYVNLFFENLLWFCDLLGLLFGRPSWRISFRIRFHSLYVEKDDLKKSRPFLWIRKKIFSDQKGNILNLHDTSCLLQVATVV